MVVPDAISFSNIPKLKSVASMFFGLCNIMPGQYIRRVLCTSLRGYGARETMDAVIRQSRSSRVGTDGTLGKCNGTNINIVDGTNHF
jgi:hypothetical protein